jgi:hypothetical protein
MRAFLYVRFFKTSYKLIHYKGPKARRFSPESIYREPSFENVFEKPPVANTLCKSGLFNVFSEEFTLTKSCLSPASAFRHPGSVRYHWSRISPALPSYANSEI